MPSPLEESHEIPESKFQAMIADLDSRLAVICTHPWGPLGGNMHNNVVVAATLYFQNLGITTLRFDFSGSQIGRGHSQVKQVEEAAHYLLTGKHLVKANSIPPSYILLVGYSYGSLITASASASIPQCIGYVLIAPPISVAHWLLCFNAQHHMNQAKKRERLPRLYVIGSDDNFTSEANFREAITSFPPENTTGAVLKGADHFFARREKDLMLILGQWLLKTYPATNGNLSNLSGMEFQAFVDHTRSASSPTKENAGGGSLFSCAAALDCPGDYEAK